MTFRTSTVATLLAVVGLGFDAAPVMAQPVPPLGPQRPAFSPYLNMLGPGGPVYNYWGIVQPQLQFMQQNYQLQQQLQLQNQNLASLQNYMYSGVNPYMPMTGRGATFNNLGHWYPLARNSTGGGGGGMMMPVVAPRPNMGMGGGMGMGMGMLGAYGGLGGGMTGTGAINRSNTGGIGPRR